MLLAEVALLLLFHSFTSCDAAAFTNGNILALRVGSASTLTSASASIFVDEIEVGTGTVVQTLAVPDSGPSSCTLSGNLAAEGLLTASFDGEQRTES